jgi:hypothetical protein
MKAEIITNKANLKDCLTEEMRISSPFCLLINEIERDYSSVPMLWCEGCGCRAVLDLRNPVLVQNDFKLENDPLIDFPKEKNRSLNCGISYDDINSGFKFMFEISLFYIKRISTRDFYMFFTSKKYDNTESLIFLKFKKCLEKKRLYDYFFLSQLLKKLEIYTEFMTIIFGKETEKVMNILNEKVKVFSELQADVDNFIKDKNNDSLKWNIITDSCIHKHKSFRNVEIDFCVEELFNLREWEEFAESAPVNSFDIENPRDKYSDLIDTSHDGITIYFEYYDDVEKKMCIGDYSGD